jgi:hypothetical protein
LVSAIGPTTGWPTWFTPVRAQTAPGASGLTLGSRVAHHGSGASMPAGWVALTSGHVTAALALLDGNDVAAGVSVAPGGSATLRQVSRSKTLASRAAAA